MAGFTRLCSCRAALHHLVLALRLVEGENPGVTLKQALDSPAIAARLQGLAGRAVRP